jgi:hypothetical protein
MASLTSRMDSLNSLNRESVIVGPYEPLEVKKKENVHDEKGPFEGELLEFNLYVLIDDVTDLDNNVATSLQQRLAQPYDQPNNQKQLKPRRITLRTKRLKRCRTCNHMLIKRKCFSWSRSDI